MHDRIAELRGLNVELGNCENGPRRESRKAAADDVRAEIARVRGELEEQAAGLEEQAKELAEQGQDGIAGQATEEARTIREALAEDDAHRGGPQAKENAADSRPKQTASSRGARASKS
jgi:dsDNA-specific endonuclease/ATPase MutS2